MDCPKIDANLNKCNCTYEPCERKGKCCECIKYHKYSNELPACFFDTSTERTYDRSYEMFIKQLNS